ncbi:hypothetical protein CNMCM5793_005271 [Aspergillus hiratsukae]|uniref:Transcription factor domain-containing protein n=1 Tax=Aspergillus hiratsukae TaxID=1194566 RepID=A0A8H6UUW0_9EURO|nr:hypothetical protein CNMCM5793_005271 [Aspergillus hiratsukae]KAF7167833.1 hypothetical protein CNMCM6106_003249 [Aspergillus hiratsukae]
MCALSQRERQSLPASPSVKRKAQSPLVQESCTLQNSNPESGGKEEENLSLPGKGRAAAVLLKGHPRTYHDALTLLSEACEYSETRKDPVDGPFSHFTGSNNPHSLGPNISESALGTHPSGSSRGTNEALRAWSNVRFVRGGLFTAEEALDMIDHFYNFHAHFSPVVPECFRDHSQHAVLIEEEPILTITILMIGSRYRKWTGPAAVARSYIVHDRVWRYLQRMISRLVWSEDNFLREFSSRTHPSSSPGEEPHSSYPGIWSNGFRTLGTCEALLLLLDWHPRALHFPPLDEDTTSIVIREPKKPRRSVCTPGYYGPGSGHDWLARSDRLCHSMLSTLLMLATEMGIFCEEDSLRQGVDGRRDLWKIPRDQERFNRIRCLIWVYATQQPGRPGWRTLTPSPPRRGSDMKNDDATECWVRVATITKNANELLFPSQRHTSEIIRNGQYLKILQNLEPLLQESIIKFDQAKLARQTRSILTIEYAYVRLCIFSVALQAVIDRRYYDGTSDIPERSPLSASKQDEEHLRETVKAAQTILRTVLDDLIPHGSLTYIPVRSYSRLLGATLFLLKSCAAGIKEIDISTSLDLVKRTAVGLRDSAVDDTHLSRRWGDLLESLASRLQSRLVQPNTSNPSTARPFTNLPGNLALPVGVPPTSHQARSSTYPKPTEDRPQARADLEFNDVLDPNRWSVDDGRRGPHFEAWSMWWNTCLSQPNVNDMPWYPTLGLVDGSEPVLHSDGGGGILDSTSGLPGPLY